MRTTFLLFSLSFILLSCGGQPSQPKTESVPLTTAESIQQLLKQADSSISPQKEDLRLQAADLLLQEGQRDLVANIINNIQAESLPLKQFAMYTETRSRLSSQRGQYEEALLLLEAPRLQQNIDLLPQRNQLTLNLLQAEILARLGSHIASAQQRIYINPLLSEEDQRSNREAIWESLMYVPMADIKHYLSSSFRGEYQGWLQLAVIAKENQGDLDLQVSQLEEWQQQWPEHPANQQLPGGLELIQELAANRPQRVALLLPLTGKLAPFGKAVRDGFIAASYETAQRGGKVPSLSIYNTEDHEDFIALYQQAVAEGAQMVVGPLEKERLRLLFDEVALPVPTLGLNRIVDYGEPPAQLFQFALSPRDEALQIAEIARLENKSKVLIISPIGEWGDINSQYFSDYWQELGGSTVGRSQYSGQKDYSNTTKDALLIQESESRAKRIQNLVGEHIEFTPRRRQDIDMVFMLARPQEARSLKPLLAYHYAGDIPVYGTSRLYTGYEDRVKNRDLNGIRFTDMPWVLEKPSTLHQRIEQEIDQSKQYQRMYALGIDSFQLHPRLRQLAEMTNSRVYGQTGRLKLNAQRQIERQMLYAKISSGRTKIIPTASQSVNLKLSTKDGVNNAGTVAN